MSAPVFDVATTQTQNYNDASPLDISHAAGASANGAVIAITRSNRSTTNGSILSVTYGGVSATLLGVEQTQVTGLMSLWAVKGITGGTQTVSVSYVPCVGGNDTMLVGITSYTNVDQTTGWQNYNTNKDTSGGPVTVTITDVSGNLIVAAGCLTEDSAALTASTVTDRLNFTGTINGDPMRLAMGEVASGASVAASWTIGAGAHWICQGVALIGISASGNPPEEYYNPSTPFIEPAHNLYHLGNDTDSQLPTSGLVAPPSDDFWPEFLRQNINKAPPIVGPLACYLYEQNEMPLLQAVDDGGWTPYFTPGVGQITTIDPSSWINDNPLPAIAAPNVEEWNPLPLMGIPVTRPDPLRPFEFAWINDLVPPTPANIVDADPYILPLFLVIPSASVGPAMLLTVWEAEAGISPATSAWRPLMIAIPIVTMIPVP